MNDTAFVVNLQHLVQYLNLFDFSITVDSVGHKARSYKCYLRGGRYFSHERWFNELRSSNVAMSCRYCAKCTSSRSLSRFKCASRKARMRRPFWGLSKKFLRISSNMIVFLLEYKSGNLPQITANGLTCNFSVNLHLSKYEKKLLLEKQKIREWNNYIEHSFVFYMYRDHCQVVQVESDFIVWISCHSKELHFFLNPFHTGGRPYDNIIVLVFNGI